MPLQSDYYMVVGVCCEKHTSFMVATNFLNMMQERTVATDSLACLAQMLKRSRPLLQCMLAQESLAAVEFFYTRSVCMRSQTIVASC
jgi:hypothetical protein